MFRKSSLIILLILLSFLFFNCPPVVEEEDFDISIDDLGWYIENIDTSYWTGTAPDATCFYDFFIHFKGNFSLGDISYARVYAINSTIFWNLPINSTFVDMANKVIMSPRFYYETPGHYLPIGNVKGEIKLKNGQKASFDKIIPAPGSTSQGTYNFVYTEAYSSTPGADFAPMVKKASVTSYSKNDINQTVSITFSINDNKVCDGWIWFYDSSNNYIGVSTHFIDTATGNLYTSLFTGGVFNTNGTNNTFNITDTDITFGTGYDFSNIAKFIIVLRDGKQYMPDSYSSYDCRSISVKSTF